MVAQEITYLIKDKNQPIAIEALNSKETMEVNAYLLSRSLIAVEELAAENIKITINDRAFEGIKKQLGK